MSTEVEQQLLARLDRIERLVVKALPPVLEPALTKKEFAKRAGIGRTTLYRRIEERRVRTEQGRIPASELSKFLSSPVP